MSADRTFTRVASAPRDEIEDSPNAARIGAILTAAAEVFSKKSFAATTMREIARRSGASLGSIYYHFENKESILRAIICGNFREVQRSLQERLTGVDDARQALEIFIANHVEFFARHVDEMRVMSHELDTLTGEGGREVATLRRQYFARAHAILQQLRPGLLEEELHVAALSLFGMLNWTYRWFHTLQSDLGPAKLGGRMSALFLEGFLERRAAVGESRPKDGTGGT